MTADGALTICICGVQVPFVVGGATYYIESLRHQLEARGHRVEVVTLPFSGRTPREVLKSCIAWRLVELRDTFAREIDLVIATSFPSYFVRHPRKITWVLHQFRPAYDSFMTLHGGVDDRDENRRFREALVAMDRRALGESRRVFALSRRVAERLDRWTGVESEALYHPPRQAERFRSGPYGDELLAVSRLEGNKRLALLVEALARTRHPMRCTVVGRGGQEAELCDLAGRLKLKDRVRFVGWLEDDELVEAYSRVFAVYFAPFDEDYGYVTHEAFLSARPVVTAVDSGGVLEFVEEGVTGLVCEPTPEALARALDRLYEDRDLCARLGTAGRRRAAAISWDVAVDKLLAVAREMGAP